MRTHVRTYVRTHVIRVRTHVRTMHTHVRTHSVRMHPYARAYVRAYAQYLHTFFVQVRRRKIKGTFPIASTLLHNKINVDKM